MNIIQHLQDLLTVGLSALVFVQTGLIIYFHTLYSRLAKDHRKLSEFSIRRVKNLFPRAKIIAFENLPHQGTAEGDQGIADPHNDPTL